MSIIEKALKRVAAAGASPEVGVRVPADRPRIEAAARSEAAYKTVPAYPRISLDEEVLEQSRILPTISDKRALRAYKILRTMVLQRLVANKWQDIAVTAAGTGEGKTLTAINLALALAQDLNTWVFLVDLDLQRPGVARSMGLSPAKGLDQYLKGTAELEEVIYSPGFDRIAVIPSFEPVEHSSELITSPRMMDFVRALKGTAPRRVIVYDTPPLLATDDLLAFAPHIDAVLLVVAEGITEREHLERAIEMLAGLNLLGTVLNRSREANESPYY